MGAERFDRHSLYSEVGPAVESILNELALDSDVTFRKRLRSALSQPLVRDDLRNWLRHAKADVAWHDLTDLEDDQFDDGICRRASELTQSVVLALYPGPGAFQAAYVHAHVEPSKRQLLKRAIRVPMRSGTVGWIVQSLLRNAANRSGPVRLYEYLPDASLDLRGHVASADYFAGNRSVIAFPVSSDPDRIAATNVCGVFFISHPVPHAFSSAKNPHELYPELKARLASIQRRLGPLSNALQGCMLTHYSRRLLAQPDHFPEQALIPLGADDPAGVLAAASLTETGVSKTSEFGFSVEINEEVYAERLRTLFREVLLFPKGNSVPFIDHLNRMSALLNGNDSWHGLQLLFPRTGMPDEEILPLYCDTNRVQIEKISRTLSIDLGTLHGRPRGDSFLPSRRHSALAATQRLYELGAGSHCDVVLPVFAGTSTQLVGFFRINCECSQLAEAAVQPYRTIMASLEAVQSIAHRTIGLLIDDLDESPVVTGPPGASVRKGKRQHDLLKTVCQFAAESLRTYLQRPGSSNDYDLAVSMRLIMASLERRQDLLKQWTDALSGDSQIGVKGEPVFVSVVSFWPLLRGFSVESASAPDTAQASGDWVARFDELLDLEPDLPGLLSDLYPIIRHCPAQEEFFVNFTDRRHLAKFGLDLGRTPSDLESLALRIPANQENQLTFTWQRKGEDERSLMLNCSDVGRRLSGGYLAITPSALATRICAGINRHWPRNPQTWWPEGKPVPVVRRDVNNGLGDLTEALTSRPEQVGRHWNLTDFWQGVDLNSRGERLAVLRSPDGTGAFANACLSINIAIAKRNQALRRLDRTATRQSAERIIHVAHGYKTPLKQIRKLAARTIQSSSGSADEINRLDRMLEAIQLGGKDAMYFAEHQRPTGRRPLNVRADIEQVLLAYEVRQGKDVQRGYPLDSTFELNIADYDFRHYLAKLVANAFSAAYPGEHPVIGDPKIRLLVKLTPDRSALSLTLSNELAAKDDGSQIDSAALVAFLQEVLRNRSTTTSVGEGYGLNEICLFLDRYQLTDPLVFHESPEMGLAWLSLTTRFPIDWRT